MKYILVINNIVEAIFQSQEEVPDDLKNVVISVDSLPDLIYIPGKDPYYYCNGTSVEVKYADVPLSPIEQLQVNQASIVYQLMQNGVI